MNLFRARKPRPFPPVARRMRELELASARLIRAGFAGDYHSAFHGRGIEFSQVREYQPGDDIRTIDWNVTARSGVPHVKEFVEERDLTVMVMIDVSGSMSFGSLDRRKSDLAAELASIFLFSAVANADRAGLILFSDRVHAYVPPRRGRAHAQTLVRTAIGSAASGHGSADLELATRFLERVHRRRAVVLLLSDFLDLRFERTLQRMSGRHDVIALSITDPREQHFPAGALLRMVDSETGEHRLVDPRVSDPARHAGQRSRDMDERFRRAGVDHLELSTAAPYDRQLLQFFRQRRQRRR